MRNCLLLKPNVRVHGGQPHKSEIWPVKSGGIVGNESDLGSRKLK